MKFIVNSQLIYRHLQALNGVITNNNTVPIISCFLFHLENGMLTIKATDLSTTLVTKIEVETGNITGANEVAVPSKLLLDIMKLWDDVPLNFEVNEENFAIKISSGEGHYNLAGLNPETYPITPSSDGTNKLDMASTTIVNAITKTAFAANSEDELHPAMSGIYCELGPEGICFVATDAHKLVRYRRNDVTSDDDASFIFPCKPLVMVKNILASYKENIDVAIEYNSTNIFFTFDNFFIACRLIDAKYPNYSAAIPQQNPNKLTLDRVSFLNALRRVALFANKSTNQVRLSIEDHELGISAEDIELSNNAQEKIPCAYQGEPMEIGFNAKFLTEMVSNLETESILVELSHPSRAGIFFPIHEGEENTAEDILMLVMPVMLANN